MRKTLAILFTCLLLCFSAQAEEVGSIEAVDPPGAPVAVKTPQGATQWREAGSAVSLAETILPSANETVVLRLKDGSEVTAAPASEVSVSDYSPGEPGSVPHIQLNQGSAHFDVKKTSTGHPSFYIRTNSAVLGVRGTEFVVDQQSDGYSVVHTLEGRVAMAKSESDLDHRTNSVEIPAGQTSYLHRSMRAPATPKPFNRDAYLKRLGKTYPGLIKRMRGSRQQVQDAGRQQKALRVRGKQQDDRDADTLRKPRRQKGSQHPQRQRRAQRKQRLRRKKSS